MNLALIYLAFTDKIDGPCFYIRKNQKIVFKEEYATQIKERKDEFIHETGYVVKKDLDSLVERLDELIENSGEILFLESFYFRAMDEDVPTGIVLRPLCQKVCNPFYSSNKGVRPPSPRELAQQRRLS